MSAFETKPDICDAVAADIERFKVIDPACDGLLGVYLFYKGVHALACARVANHYWEERGETGRLIARLLQRVKPTLVVFSGDIIDGRMCSDHVAAMAEVVAPCQAHGIPWCFTRKPPQPASFCLFHSYLEPRIAADRWCALWTVDRSGKSRRRSALQLFSCCSPRHLQPPRLRHPDRDQLRPHFQGRRWAAAVLL